MTTREKLMERLAPGTVLREGVERIIKAGKGAIIVLGYTAQMDEMRSGGFKLRAKVTAPHLSEVAKMDGAILLDEDCETILWANVHLVPSSSIETEETGTRHRTADRVAKETGIPVISVSESMQIVSLYVDQTKYVLEDLTQIMFRANQALATLERYRNRLNEVTTQLSAMEIDQTVTLGSVVSVLQRTERVSRIAREIETYVRELGFEGRLLELQLDELMRGVEEERNLVIKDYLSDRRRKITKVIEMIASLEAAELLEHAKIVDALGYSVPDQRDDDPVQPRGYRLLSRIPRLPDPAVEKLVERYGGLDRLLSASVEDLNKVEGIGDARARAIKERMVRLAETSTMDRYAGA